MKRMGRAVVAGVAMAALLSFGSTPMAQAAGPAGMKMYAFSSGGLTIAKSALQAGGQGQITVPVGFFVIMHPKGNVLFDTGNNDKIITDPSYWGPFIKGLTPERSPDVAIDTQLRKIGLSTDDIKYIVVGHMHLDHGGNLCKFPKSTVLVSKDEMQAAAWPPPGYNGPYIPGDVACLRSEIGEAQPNRYNMMMLDGDFDIFGDGSIVVKRWPGHTPGTQMAVVRLPQTGTVVLTTDNVYLSDSVTKNLLPDVGLAYYPTGILKAYEFIRFMQASEGASFMTAHDTEGPAQKARMSHQPQLFP